MIFVLVTGFGLILAPLCILVRDVERVVPMVLRVVFYLSPIIFSVTVVEERTGSAALLAFNPFSGIMVIFRSIFFPEEMHWNFVAISAIECVLILCLGLFTFGRLERAVLKEI
jgi:ABC-2 type transport system permease protein